MIEWLTSPTGITPIGLFVFLVTLRFAPPFLRGFKTGFVKVVNESRDKECTCRCPKCS